LAWGAADLNDHFRRPSDAITNSVLVGTAVLLVVALAAVSKHQLKYWRTGQDLLEHVLAVTGDSAMVHNNLGVLLMAKRDWPGAEKHFTTALRLEPMFPEPKVNLARVLAHQGRPEEATQMLNGLNLELQIRERLQLADILLQRKMTNEAVMQYSDVLKLSPTNAPARESLGLLLAEQGKISEAAEQFDALVRLRPDGSSHYQLALSLLIQGETEEAIAHYKEAIRLKPDWPEPLNDLAWLLATYPRVDLRNGPEAVELAERACKLTNYKEARFLGTLDAAYAEAGQFPEAIKTAERAKNLALTANDKSIADLADERLKLYRSGVPFHQQQ
jgi:tetratricopeptide (TPR) repeat protein